MSFWKRIIGGGGGSPRGKAGARAYAVGDIHGRLDLLDEVLARIEDDAAHRRARKTWAIFLGDLIDRGPDSAGVIERLRTWRPEHIRPVFLAGNHEEVFLTILGGDPKFLANWLKFGGAECAASYGVDPDLLRRVDEDEAVAMLRARVPRRHREFLEGFADTFAFGDYLFVHAGIRPGIAIEEQDRTDLRWIRDPFLRDTQDHGCVVVHGHTISKAVDERTNRIGIDTGAYKSGILTALAVEGERRWFLATGTTPARELHRG
ncbi:MAG: serine/threonine protein phosphatase [Alphaproteobacteria bacterium]|nr:serine/threonine protein phosphatase [Alphaproteobacteria bacterium]